MVSGVWFFGVSGLRGVQAKVVSGRLFFRSFRVGGGFGVFVFSKFQGWGWFRGVCFFEVSGLGVFDVLEP